MLSSTFHMAAVVNILVKLTLKLKRSEKVASLFLLDHPAIGIDKIWRFTSMSFAL